MHFGLESKSSGLVPVFSLGPLFVVEEKGVPGLNACQIVVQGNEISLKALQVGDFPAEAGEKNVLFVYNTYRTIHYFYIEIDNLTTNKNRKALTKTKKAHIHNQQNFHLFFIYDFKYHSGLIGSRCILSHLFGLHD